MVIGSGEAAMDLSDGTIIIQVNKAHLIEEEVKYLLSTEQAIESFVKVENVAKGNGVNHHIHSESSIITLKIHCSLLHFLTGIGCGHL